MAVASVIIPSRDEGPLLGATLEALLSTPAGAPFEVVVVDDGSRRPVVVEPAGVRLLRSPGIGVAAARNLGAAASDAPVLCFCDAHLTFAPGWLGRLCAALEDVDAVCPGIAAADRPAAVGYGFTWGPDYGVRWLDRPAGQAEVPFLPGGCLALRRDAFVAVGGFDAALAPWGHEDAELSWALWLSGRRCATEPRALVQHHFRARHPYPVSRPSVDGNLLRVGCLHLSTDRLARLAARLRADGPTLAATYAAAAGRRLRLAPGRRHDDAWLCARFALPI